MPLHVITGRATAGKTGELNAHLLASLERGESPVLVLPSVADTRRATAEFAGKAPTGVAISTLRRWANGLWSLHGDGRRIVGDSSRVAFVRRAIADVKPPVLEAIAESPGFSAMIARTVAAMVGRPAVHGPTSGAMRGVVDICARYLELIEAGGLVEEAEAWRALGAAPPVLDGTAGINRFTELDEPVIALLTGLSRRNDVVVALTWEKDFAPTRALDTATERLRASADRVTPVSEPAPAGELGALMDGLYAGAAGIVGTGAVQMGLAAGSEAEAHLVARFAAEAITGGTPPERVVVAFPDLERVAHRVESAFAAAGLSCDVDLARPVAATALGRSLHGLLTLSQAMGDRTTAMGVLLGPHSDVPHSTAADLDRAWRRSRVSDPNRLLDDMSKLEGTFLGRAAMTARELAARPVAQSTGRKWQHLTNALVSAAAARASMGESVSARSLAAAVRDDASAARAIVRAVEEMASVEGTPFSAGDVRTALHTIVAGGTAGERFGRVQITEIPRLHSRRFDTVIIGGLTAGEMPTATSDSLADELREYLAPGTGRRGEEHVRLAFYQAASRARSRLVLVRRDADDRGAPVRPSVLWEEVVDAYRKLGESVDEWPACGPPRVHVGASDIAASAPVFTRGRRELRQQAADGSCVLGAPSRGELTDSSTLELLAPADIFSATEIETYLQCPYRWFYERVVRPEEIDVEVDARAIGTIAHELLRAFYDALPVELGVPRVTPENRVAALGLLGKVVARRDPGVRAEGLAEELGLARAIRWAQTTVADDALVLPGFLPTDQELGFGGPDQATVSLGGVGFKGRIDRVDRSSDAVFVTDYKSSRRVSGYAKFADESKIQAVVYALAAGKASGLPVAGSVYRSLRSRRMRGFWRSDLVGGELAFGSDDDAIGDGGFDELLGETAERIETAVAGIRTGRVPREPSDKNACTYCALKAQCEEATR